MIDFSADPAIRIEHVRVDLGAVHILDDVNVVVPRGESTAIVGPNGAGKTTLTLAILGQIPFQGSIRFPALPAPRRRPRFGFVPQKLQFDRDMPMSVMDFLLAGRQRFPLFFGNSRRLVMKIQAMLDEVECRHLEQRSFGALSGGELQRVLLAQALLQNPEILVLDEPTAGVDFKGGQICCELLRRIRARRGFTQIMISHDLATVSAHATHVICLNHTVRAQGDPKQVLTHEVLSETFGLHMGVPALRDMAADAMVCDAACVDHGLGHQHSCTCSSTHPAASPAAAKESSHVE